MISRAAKLAYPIRDGIPIMLPEEARRSIDIRERLSAGLAFIAGRMLGSPRRSNGHASRRRSMREKKIVIKIWGRKTSSNVQKVMWAVGEIGLPHERIDIAGPFGRIARRNISR